MAPEQSPTEKLTQSLEPFGSGNLLGNRYRIVRQLGKGGFGVVYLAHDEQLHQRPVVIKVLTEGDTQDEWLESRFRKEAEALSRIDHPGVVGVLDQGTASDGKLFIVMQFVDGVTLRSVLERGPLELSRAADLLSQTAEALTAAHDQDICHRDLKPENIMVRKLPAGREQAVIIDFGIAAVKHSAVASSAQTKVAGSLQYMAPEQMTGNPEIASDIYSLGVSAYEMVTGRPPFKCNSPVEFYFQQQEGVQQKPSQLRPELPAGAESAILKALAFNSKDRYVRALDFGEAFSHSLTDSVPEPVTRRSTQATAPIEPAPAGPELAFVLFMDVVRHSQLPTDQQFIILQKLQELVRGTPEYHKAHTARDLISLPTGDGMALVFFSDPYAPVKCAIELSRALKSHPEIRLRMGINTGPVFRMADINENRNVAGGGINLAQRVMDCGDDGHILVSSSVADILGQLSEWSPWLQDFGECEVKHGVRMHIYNICRDDVGNPARPLKLDGTKRVTRRYVLIAALVALLVAAAVAVRFLPVKTAPRPVEKSPPAVEKVTLPPARTLAYYFTVRKPKSQEWKRYSKERIVPAKYDMRFYFSSPQPGHLYLLNEGPVPRNNMASFNLLGASVLSTDQTLQFPPGAIHLDEDEGVEKLYIIWSSQEIPQLEELKRWANSKDLGAVQSPADVAKIQDFLQKNPSKARAEEQTDRTVLIQEADPLVYMVRLEHQ
ncbi:MAG: protein kinase [Bryobacteraceae bacterium]